MVKQKSDDVKEEVKKQDEEVYGDTSVSGSMPDPDSDDDVDEVVGEALGKDAAEDLEEGKSVSLADEVEEDEQKRRTRPEIYLDDEEEE